MFTPTLQHHGYSWGGVLTPAVDPNTHKNGFVEPNMESLLFNCMLPSHHPCIHQLFEPVRLLSTFVYWHSAHVGDSN